MMVEPEYIIFGGAFLWGCAGFATAIPQQRFPPEYPFLFFGIAVLGTLIGISELVPEPLDTGLTFAAAVIFFALPIVAIYRLFNHYPPAEKRKQDGNAKS